uniref:Subtilisin-like protease fibronectin type-III domain-containing protein n=1 Tax=Fagus sylvatica TaxID=28930 RepID=A0A2N9ITZ6_FAGSY
MHYIAGVGHNDEKVLVLAATNTPYALDQAIRRRFDKRIYIPLPDAKARQHMFKVHLGDTPHNLNESDYESLGRKTEGFSGSDIAVCVKDVLFEPVRKTQDAMFFVRTPSDNWVPCGPKQQGAVQITMQELAAQGLASKVKSVVRRFYCLEILPPPISKADFDKVLARQRPTVSKSDLEVHERFTKEFGEEVLDPVNYSLYIKLLNMGKVTSLPRFCIQMEILSFDGAQEAALHHYSKSFRGFSAMLTPEQAQQLADKDSVVSVFQSKMNKLHTTHSWEFLGIDSTHQYNQMPMVSNSNIIVGVIDTGIWPESKSFNDKGLGPVPKKFKGECVTGDYFGLANCNRKIIGARFYSKGFEAESGPLESFNLPFFRSARDSEGHGTHTASTIAGSIVANVSLFGMARGTARGGAPGARLAIYKACWFDNCNDADILSALDDAISDGVDILSLSLGPNPPQPSYFENAISIGSFHAFQRGILVSASAGNSGFPRTATNVAPWILTVAASTVDREFNSVIYLGNSKVLKGFSLNPIKMETSYGLIAGSAAAAPGVMTKNASFCKNNTLDQTLVKGKIVVCTIETFTDNRSEKSIFLRDAGAVGMILIDSAFKDVGFQFVIPGTLIGQEETEELQAYMISEKNPVGKILPTVTVLNTKPAPEVAVFSSMGPNIITPDIIKPDITGPGVNILAAWSPVATTATAERSVNYNIISGTSMSCPHVSAVAAILKSYQPSWSPAAIMSAIMTTAMVLDNTQHAIGRDPNGTPTTPFDYGSGHINPIGALNPGLIYDFNSHDIINFLCSTGASPAQLKNLTGELVHCQNPPTPSYNFNYPSIGVANMNGSLSLYRTVTYYGKDPTVYVASIDYPTGVKVEVTPAKLKFTKIREKISFRVDFIPFKNSNGSFVFGSLTWSNGIHRVRSPIGLNVVSV